MKDYAIQTNQLDYAYRNKEKVLHNLNLQMEKGKIYSFLGPNGAGKSTTIKLLLGLLLTNQGSIELLGYNNSSERIDVNKRIGVLVESPGLYEHLSGRRNLEIQASLRGIDKARIDEELRQVSMEQAAKSKVKTYSTGMKQRLGLAIALLQKPELLILDEPTNGLDPKGIREIRDLLINLNKELGISIFLSTHLISEAEKVSHSIGIIQKGKLVFQGTRNELQNMKSFSSTAIIRTEDNEKASSILEGERQVKSGEEGRLIVDCKDEKELAQLNRKLLDNQLEVYHLSMHQSDLEEMFLTLTNEES